MALIQKAFSDIITFSRSSNATRVGPTGLVEYAPHNLILQSQTFDNASWATGNATVTANAAPAPDGTVTAELLIENSSNAEHRVFQSVTTVASTYTVSCYIKANTRNWAYIRIRDSSSADRLAFFNLATGVIGTVQTGLTASIQSVGNNWYRCVVTISSAFAGSNPIVLGVSSADNTEVYTGNGTGSIYLWGAQLSVGPYALDYTPTTSAAVYGPRFDYDGSGVTIVEPVSTNLLTYSQAFADASWVVRNATKTSTIAIDPNGGTTALTLTKTANDSYSLRKTTGINPAGKTYAVSAYLKGSGTCVLLLDNSIDQDLVSQTITLTSTWTRYSFAGTANSTSGNLAVAIRLDAGSASSVDIAFFQVEIGSTATAYMVSGATNGFRAVPVVSGSATARGLLVEEQRVNSMTYSEDLSNAAWSKSGATVSANFAASPDGQVIADKIVENSATSNHEVFQSVSITSGTTYTLSFFAKAAGRDYVACGHNGTSSYAYSYFNLANGTVVSSGSGHTTSIQSFGNGWYRVISTFTAGVTASVAFEILVSDNGSRISYAGDGSSGILIWGAQLEAGSFATSYIPTLASSVTRSADVASVNTLSPWWNNSEGSFYFEGDVALATGKYPGLYKTGTTNGQRVGQFMNTGTTSAVSYFYRVSDFVTSGSISNQAIFKLASGYSGSDVATALNGGAAATASASGSLTLPTILYLGFFDEYMSGHIRRLAYYPRKLSNAELQALSA